MKLGDFKKATKQDLEKVEEVFLNRVEGGCSWSDLYEEFEKLNVVEVKMVKNNWLCASSGVRYKISESSYIMNYDGVLRFTQS